MACNLFAGIRLVMVVELAPAELFEWAVHPLPSDYEYLSLPHCMTVDIEPVYHNN